MSAANPVIRVVHLGNATDSVPFRAEYEFFLGEAHVHAAIDDAEHAFLAIEHLRNAIGDPLLPREKRKFAEERIAIIRERTGLK